MNVYEKLNEARVRFQSMNVKKSGKNSYAGYTYYELADILPVVNQLAKELKFTCIISFEGACASLQFIDIEKPEDKIYFESPMSEASLKGCHAVQNMGAVETYIKRYLYQNCFEIVEADVLDMTMNPNEKTESKKQSVHTENPELNRLKAQVQDALNKGLFAGGSLKCAKEALANNDAVRLNKAIEYLVSLEQKESA